MLLNLSDISDEPLQSQIVRQVRAKILSGEMEEGASLPSIRTLAKDQKVSVITVQRAYETLMRENLIHSRRGKGFFVSQITKKDRKDIARDKLSEHLKRPLQSAIAEGLSRQDILRAVDDILAKPDKQTTFE